MPTEILAQCEVIEEAYEFTLSYAAQGHAPQGHETGEGSAQGRQLREHLTRAVEAMHGLGASCEAALKSGELTPVGPYETFFKVLVRDAKDSIAAVELVLAQPAISSQLIDNMNASIHLRALLTDLFLVAEILEAQQTRATASQREVV